MTKQEAIHAMVRGERVMHRFFTPEEWVIMKNGVVVFEDGVRCSLIEFWNDRTGKDWESDWEILSINPA